MASVLPLTYLFEHSLRIRDPSRLLPSPAVCEVLPCGQLVHGHHGTRRLLTSKFQHGEQIQWDRAHICQCPNLEKVGIYILDKVELEISASGLAARVFFLI